MTPGQNSCAKQDIKRNFQELNKRLDETVCLMRKSTAQVGCLANLPMVLCHYQHKQLRGTLRSVR